MSQMFKMMNGARIGVGVQGISVASSAFLNALEYAKDRKQGASIEHWKDATAPRARIIEHADVRRMLLDMKSRVEGIRALAVKLTHHQDAVRAFTGKDEQAAAYHQGQVDLLVPLVKAYGSDQGVPRLRDRDPDVRRRRLHEGLPRRAVLPRREDLLDLRRDEPHPGDGPRRAQARARRAARTCRRSSATSRSSSRRTRRTRSSARR